MRRFLIFVLPWLLLLGTSVLLLFKANGFELLGKIDTDIHVDSEHNMIVHKIESLGKLEVVKYFIKDIVEYNEDIPWWPFDPQSILIVNGEVIGCIDLTQIDSSDVIFRESLITVYLPPPDICMQKVNHQTSRVYQVSNISFKEDAELIDAAYKIAEVKLGEAAQEMNINEQTRQNARSVLKPLLETLTGKKVKLVFR